MLSIPGFTINSQLYDGSASLVYRAVREADQRSVILKVLRHPYPSPQDIARYRQEYDLLRSLSLPGVIQVYDYIPYEHTYGIVCEDFGGEALSHWMEQWPQIYCPMQTAEFLKLAITLADILHQIHRHQVIHKDINPSNMVLNPATGQIKLIDFGLSTQFSQTDADPAPPSQLEGTLAYLSPEQTGRMNRALDYRTDLYSLGITFYHLLTGRLPFPSEDLLELVHGHLAKSPPPPHGLVPTIPPVLSALVQKLIAKDADDRYQSALGLKADLEQCLAQWQATGRVTNFPLARQDFTGRLKIPHRLYGREAEVAALQSAFDQVAEAGESPPQLIVLTGGSGVGKSALVRELYPSLTQWRGYFLRGKFEQYQRNVPYQAVVVAFGGLVRQLLGESEAALQRWRERILTAVGGNGWVITEVLPEVERIIGPQPEVPQLGAMESQNRFNYVFQAFVRVFCQANHPLILFLDDLQWADTASLNLLQQMLTDRKLQALLVLGTYRSNEVTVDHPLQIALEALQGAGVTLQSLALAPLTAEQVGQLLADTLHQPPGEIADLAALVMRKTTGNPFFLNQFLKTLHSRGWLTFDFERRRWRWDMAQIESANFTDNVAALMVADLRQLPPSTQRLLQLAACVGAEFDEPTLVLVMAQAPEALRPDLALATQHGLLFPIPGPTGDRYRFAHDQVQQAAYELLEADQRCQIHRQIGRQLWQATPPAQLSDRLLTIADHLNLGLLGEGGNLDIDTPERLALADLNLQAGIKAKTSLAYDAALGYLQAGLALLGDGAWATSYRLALRLHEEAAEAAYLSGNMAQTEDYIATVLACTTSPLDRVRSFLIKIQALASQGNLQGAIAAGLPILQELGFYLPQQPTVAEGRQAVFQINALLSDRTPEEILALPLIEDPIALAATQVLTKMTASAYISAPNLLPLIVLKIIELSLQYGNTQGSAMGYVGYALFSCSLFGQIETGYRFGQLAAQLATQLRADPFQAKVLNVVGGHINVWKDPLRDIGPVLRQGHENGLAMGDFEHAGYTLFNLTSHLYFSGQPLTEVLTAMETHAQIMGQIRQDVTMGWLSIFIQAVLNLRSQLQPQTPSQLIGAAYDETEAIPLAQRQGNLTALHHVYLMKLMLSYLFGQYGEAVDYANQAEQYLDAVMGLFASAVFCFYDALAQLALPQPDFDRVEARLKKLHLWATHGPANCLHRAQLVEAEKARRLGHLLEAEDAYDQAIATAQTHQHWQEEALALELAAQFYRDRGRERIALTYLQEAHYAYRLWGATAKVSQLEAQFPYLASPTRPPRPTLSSTQPSLGSQQSSQQTVDLQAVLRATQAISSEIEMSRLLSSLMKILLENAGAQKGFLALPLTAASGPEHWFIEAVGEAETAPTDDPLVEVLQHLPLVGQGPLTLINTVLRCRESVVIHDATQAHDFAADPYFQTQPSRSILCAPLLNQGMAVGLVYLENTLTAGAFTLDRLEVVQLLSGQAAISIYNARLYAQLRDSEAQVRQSEQRLKQFLDAIPVGVSVVDARGQLAYHNAKAQAIQGEASPLLHRHQPVNDLPLYRADSDEIYPVPDLPTTQALAGHPAYANDIELRQGDQRIPLEVIATPILNDQGEVAYAIAAFSDITERRAAQRLLADYNRTLETQVQERTDALTRQWEMLQTLVDQIPVMLAFYDAEGHVILVNPAVADTLGWSMDDLRQEDWLERAYPNPQDRQRAEDHWKRANGTWLDATILCRQGQPIDTTWAYVRLSDGRTIGIGQDITDRKRMEASLRSQAEAERLLSIITQHIRQSLDLSEILATTVAEVQRNLAADRVLILKFSTDPRDQGQVRVIQAVASPEYAIPSLLVWQQDCSLKDCYASCIQGKPRIYPSFDLQGCLSPFIQAWGVKTEVVAPILYPRSGEPGDAPQIWGLLMVQACQTARHWHTAEADFLQRISNQLAIAIYQSDLYYQLQRELKERRQTETALRQSEARLTAAQAIARLGNWELDAATGAMVWSDQLVNLAGLQTIQGVPNYADFLAMCHPEDLEPLNQQVTTALEYGTPYRAIFRFIRPDQSICYVESRAEAEVNAEGQVIRLLGTAQDISDRYEIDRMKDEFIGIVSHELRTPMTAIQSALIMLSAGAFDDDPDQAAQMLRIAQTNTERLVRLVNDVLDLERLESGKAELILEPVAIHDLVQDSIDTLQPLANQAQVNLVWHPCEAEICADPDALIQTLTNLISNGIKFSEPGSAVEIEAQVMAEDDRTPCPHLRLAIADQGRGIPEDKLEIIFNRFQQVDSVDSRQKGGTGLGLAISKTIVEKHGGRLWAESILGEGSTFYLTLPLATPAWGDRGDRETLGTLGDMEHWVNGGAAGNR